MGEHKLRVSVSKVGQKTIVGCRHKSSGLWVVVSGIEEREWDNDDNSDDDPIVTKLVVNHMWFQVSAAM